MLQKGFFIVSIDVEFGMRYADKEITESEREVIVGEAYTARRLLLLFERHNIPATWAIVGHLIDRGCPWSDGGVPHPEYTRPGHKEKIKDWFVGHPPMHEYTDVLWFDDENIASMIRQSRVSHDIASHSYAFISYEDYKGNEDWIKADLKNVGRVHRVHDVPLTSFIFPNNIEGHHRLLKVNGFTNYRGITEKPYDALHGFRKDLAIYREYMIPVSETSLPDTVKFGLVNIPGTMRLFDRSGIYRRISPKKIVRKASLGLAQAAKKNEIFHLWFNLSDFHTDTNTQFEILDNILDKASALRENGELSIENMEDATKILLEEELKENV